MRLLLSLTLLLSLASPLVAEPVGLAQQSLYVRSETVQLSPGQARNFETFKRGHGHFGAFAVAREGRGSFFTRYFRSARAARLAAMEGCRRALGQPCLLYAVALPKGVSLADRDAKALGAAATQAFERRYRARLTRGSYGAFAAEASEYGYSYRWDSAAKAREVALGYCAREVAKTLRNLDAGLAGWARRSGLLTCRILEERGPAR